VPQLAIRLVLDTNIVLRGLVNIRSAAGRVLGAVDDRSVVLLLSRPVLAEYRAVLTDPVITDRYPELTTEKVEVALRRFRYFGEFVRIVKERFEYPRDPRDEMLIELSIAARATDLVTSDNDLLSLPTGHTDAAKRFRQRLPNLRVLGPAEFLSRCTENPAHSESYP
jgi:putative PIN family toxin of toxin-antitoxin system